MRVAARVGRQLRKGRGDDDVIGGSIAALTADWARVAAPLYAARAARILHLAAAVLALGVIAGLYVRGLAFEYRATWESTFVEAPTLHALLAVLYAPGAWLLGTTVPDAAQLAEKLRQVTDEFLIRENHDRPDTLESILSPALSPIG